MDYDGINHGPFVAYLKEKGIVPQYTLPGSPEPNGVAERRNRTYLDAIRSMMSYSSLPESFWGEALKTAAYILNRVPCKAASEIPYKLWTGRKPSLNHLHVWGCLAEAKLYNPDIKKLDPRTVTCFFIGYPERSKGYRFYCPLRPMEIVETLHAKFVENDVSSGSLEHRSLRAFEEQPPVFVSSFPDVVPDFPMTQSSDSPATPLNIPLPESVGSGAPVPVQPTPES